MGAPAIGKLSLPKWLLAIPKGKSADIQIYISQMVCSAITKESGTGRQRDEIYLRVRGTSPQALINDRLPRYIEHDSYYEFFASQSNDNNDGWTNHDQVATGKPVLWSGRLEVGQNVDLIVAVMEQDNKDLHQLKKGVQKGLDAAREAFGSNAIAKAFLDAAVDIAKGLPDSKGDEFIGAFGVRVTRPAAGVVTMAFVPLQASMSDAPEQRAKQEDAQMAAFTCQQEGGTGNYSLLCGVRLGPAVPVRRYTGNTVDRCTGTSLLAVEGGPGEAKGFYHVDKGKSLWVPVAAPRIAWYCGMTKEAATLPDHTNVIHVHRSGSDDRKITWIGYKDEDNRPSYEPTQTWVKISNEKDQCGGARLAVEGVNGFYHLAKGEQKWVPIANRRFRWYCDLSEEFTTAPEGTNLVRVKRDASSREITWECCREIVSVDPYAKPDDNKILLAVETDQCSAEKLCVFGDNGFYVCGKGQERWVPISELRFKWLCGHTLESSKAPEGTNLLHVTRSASSREITWKCYRSLSVAEFVKPDTTQVYLGEEKDKCSSDVLTVDGAGGKVKIKKGQSNVEVHIKARRFAWWCGDTLEHTNAPELTNVVLVTRDKVDRDVTWKCYLRR